MQKFSPPQIADARTAAAEIAALFAEMEATDDRPGKDATTNKLWTLIRSSPGESWINLAREILDAKIEATRAEFVSLVRPFFNDDANTKEAAGRSDLLLQLNHDRTFLFGAPSLMQAQRLLSIFNEFLSSLEPAP